MRKTKLNTWLAGLVAFVVCAGGGGGGGGGGVTSAQVWSDPCGLAALPAPPVFPGPHAESKELRMIALQTQFAGASDPYAEFGVHNHAIMVPGTATHSGEQIRVDGVWTDITPKLFVQQSINDIRTQLQGWIMGIEGDPDNAWFDASTFTGFIILDIEHPFKPVEFRVWFNNDPMADDPVDHVCDFMPADNDTLNPEWDDYRDDDGNHILFDHILEGFNRRIRAARLEFPLAKLGVFPMIHTPSRGNCTPELEENMLAWEYATTHRIDVPRFNNNSIDVERHSWIDELNYVVVQLYPRFAECNVIGNPHTEATTTAFVSLGMEAAKRIANTEAGVGVLPMLHFELAGDSAEGYPEDEGGCDEGRPAHLIYLLWQVAAIRDYAYAGAPGNTIGDTPICFWDGDGLLSGGDMDKIRPWPEPQSIEDFLDALFDVCDLNGVGDDGGFWDPDPPFSGTTQPADPFDIIFDINGDRLITSDDETLYWLVCP